MTQTNTLYEIHVHGDIALRKDIVPEQIEEALRPLWSFAGASSFKKGAISLFQEEPGLVFDMQDYTLHICWTVQGDEAFTQAAEEFCQKINAMTTEATSIEVSYFDSDDENGEDEFQLYFVGPTPQAIINAQRDLLVKDVVDVMERHFDAVELGDIVENIDQLFSKRLEQLEKSSASMNTLWAGVSFNSLDSLPKRRLH